MVFKFALIVDLLDDINEEQKTKLLRDLAVLNNFEHIQRIFVIPSSRQITQPDDLTTINEVKQQLAPAINALTPAEKLQYFSTNSFIDIDSNSTPTYTDKPTINPTSGNIQVNSLYWVTQLDTATNNQIIYLSASHRPNTAAYDHIQTALDRIHGVKLLNLKVSVGADRLINRYSELLALLELQQPKVKINTKQLERNVAMYINSVLQKYRIGAVSSHEVGVPYIDITDNEEQYLIDTAGTSTTGPSDSQRPVSRATTSMANLLSDAEEAANNLFNAPQPPSLSVPHHDPMRLCYIVLPNKYRDITREISTDTNLITFDNAEPATTRETRLINNRKSTKQVRAAVLNFVLMFLVKRVPFVSSSILTRFGHTKNTIRQTVPKQPGYLARLTKKLFGKSNKSHVNTMKTVKTQLLKGTTNGKVPFSLQTNNRPAVYKKPITKSVPVMRPLVNLPKPASEANINTHKARIDVILREMERLNNFINKPEIKQKQPKLWDRYVRYYMRFKMNLIRELMSAYPNVGSSINKQSKQSLLNVQDNVTIKQMSMNTNKLNSMLMEIGKHDYELAQKILKVLNQKSAIRMEPTAAAANNTLCAKADNRSQVVDSEFLDCYESNLASNIIRTPGYFARMTKKRKFAEIKKQLAKLRPGV